MATQPPANTDADAANPANVQLPLFYQSISALSSVEHADWALRPRTDLNFTRMTHAVPLTVDEFSIAQKHMPIVFGSGEGAVPLGLLGLNEGQNMFIDEAGRWREGAYVPAYVRRYPFILAKLTPESTELSLCFDDTAGALGPSTDGAEALFADGKPTDTTRGILQFCEEFEQAVARTKSFMEEVEKANLLMEGEVTIQMPGQAQPSVYRGFRKVNEESLRNIRGYVARKMVGNGLMGLVYAHMFSLAEMRVLFERQHGGAPALAA